MRMYVRVLQNGSDVSKFALRLKLGVERIAKLGFDVVYDPAILGEFVFDPVRFAIELQEALLCEQTDIVIFASGGELGNATLPFVDFEKLKGSRAAVCGFSDNTAFLSTLSQFCGVTTFYGPTVLDFFAQHGEIRAFSEASFVNAVINRSRPYRLSTPRKIVNEKISWKRNPLGIPMIETNKEWETVNPGSASGKAHAFELLSMCKLLGTRFAPSFSDEILFVEWGTSNSAAVLSHLYQLFEALEDTNVKGLVVGRASTNRALFDAEVCDCVREFAFHRRIPCIRNVDFGHTNPKNVVRQRANLRMVAIPGEPLLEFV